MDTFDRTRNPSSRGPRVRRRSRLFATLLAVVSLLTTASGASAAPTAPLLGAEDAGYTPNSTLTFKLTGSGPAWFTGAGGVKNVLENEWTTNNRTGMPRFSYSSTGKGIVEWSRSNASPCSGSTSWLACTHGVPADKVSWKIYVRDFGNSGWGNAEWNESGNCGSQTCFDLSRALLHEVLHIVLKMGHDESGETSTVMSENQPWSTKVPNTGWNTNSLRSCDVATGQIFYDLHAKTDAYAQCLTAVNGLSEGIKTKITMAATNYTSCYSVPRVVAGEARVGNYGQLVELANNPLEGRTIRIYRRTLTGTFTHIGNTTATSTSLGTPNVKATLSVGGPATFVYQFRYVSTGSGIDQVLLSSNGPEFTVTWTSGPCPL